MTPPTLSRHGTDRTPSNWLDDACRAPLPEVVATLGLDLHRDGKSFGPCPSCGMATRANPGRTDRRGRCRIEADGKRWACCSNGTEGCGAKGDGLALVAWSLTGRAWAKGDSDTSAQVREWYAARGWCDASPDGGSTPATLARPRRATVAVQVNQPKPRPPAAEVAALWARCLPVTADPEMAAWLAGRHDGAIDPATVAKFDLARALPADLANLPRWARYKDGKPWTASGHRLVVRAWEADPDTPGRLRVASLHARNVLPAYGPADKAAWPGRASAAGLVLATGADPRSHGLPLVEIAEGVPDWLRLAVTVASELPKGKRSAVWGIWNGSADPALGAVVPEGWPVALRTHADDAGDKYAAAWQTLLIARGCRMRREFKPNVPQPAAPAIQRAGPTFAAVSAPAKADQVAQACEALRDAIGPDGLAVVWAYCCRDWGRPDAVPTAVANVLRCQLSALNDWELNIYNQQLREMGAA